MRRLLHAYHGDQRDLADHAVLLTIGVRAGLAATKVEASLVTARFSVEVREERAARLGVRGVPTALVDERVQVPLLRPVEEVVASLTAALRGPTGP